MTIKEIAQLAGVSVSTVSKIMNNKDKSISAETREHVLQIAKDYHYKPYASVFTSNSAKSLCIGIIFRNMADINMSVSGILSAASRHGYSVVFRESGGSAEQELKNILALLSLNTDGIIWEPAGAESLSCAKHLERANVPYIIANTDCCCTASAYASVKAPASSPAVLNTASLNINYQKMGYLATEALVKANHSEIACFLKRGIRTSSFFHGYRQCLYDYHIPLNEKLIFDEKDGLPINKIANHSFSGMVVSHYATAIQLYKAVNTLHYMIPYDLSLVSLKDDTQIKTDFPPISALTIPYTGFGSFAVNYLIGMIEKKEILPEPDFSFELDSLSSIDIPYNLRLKKVISVGSINIDNYMNFDQLPRTGKTVKSPTASIHPGGKCLNEAVGVARLGHNVSAIGRVGDDADADFLYQYVKDYPVDTIGIKRSKGLKTGQAYIFVQKDGDSMISIMSGANDAVNARDIAESERLFTNAGYCLMQTEIPTAAILEASRIAKKHHLTTVLKPSACPSLPPKLLQNTDIIVPNLEELHEICPYGQTMEDKSALLLTYGIKTVIVTLGAQGCYIRTQKSEHRIPAADFVSVDSSGAGDAFISALVSYLLYGYELLPAAKIATYAAGFSITRQGTTPSLIDKDTLESYIRQKEPELLKL